MSDLLNKRALFCDESENYRIPSDPKPGDRVTFWFRTGKEVLDSIELIFITKGISKEIKRLVYKGSDEFFNYYQCQMKVGKEPIKYYFKLTSGGETFYYHRAGIDYQVNSFDDKRLFGINPLMYVPEWAKGAIFYQIYVDRFCNGNPSTTVLDNEYIYVDGISTKQAKSWDQKTSLLDVGNFYGGDLQGVINKLDYLKTLGVEVIYFNPIFVSPSNHKYDTQDYDNVDPHYGVIIEDEGNLVDLTTKDNKTATRYISRVTRKANLDASNELFIHLVEEAHKRGMRVIIDGVFNHCGSFNKWLDKERIYESEEGYEVGAYHSKDSIYRNFFKFERDEWPDNNSYVGWWGHDTLPKLNYEGSKELCEYIFHVARKWVSPPFNADGWRLDVAADLGQSSEFNHKFWKRFRKEVRSANPEAIILAEHYGDIRPWLKGDEWDTVMNYDAFMEPVSWFLTGMEKHSDNYIESLRNNGKQFFDAMSYNMSAFHFSSLLTAMNELSNHDHSRFLTRTNSQVGRLDSRGYEAASEGINKGIFRSAVTIQMTWPGAPTIYYGDEASVCGWTDPDNRRTYPWGNEDLEMIEFHRYMTGIHRRHKSLKCGSLKELYADYGHIAYARFNEEEVIIVVINNLDKPAKLPIPVWEVGVSTPDYEIERIMSTSRSGYNSGKISCSAENGELLAKVYPYGSVVYLATKKKEKR
ncbi:Neopullulanase [Lachnospiraceae bacterium TWA4]|nr:Neopullulanase [Lachnospiraceae bacterium TWA4]